MIEIYFSTDGKNTVKVGVEDSATKEEINEAYKAAKTIFNQMLKDFPGTKMGSAMEKAEKEEKLGNCPDCGAPMAWSTRTNKPYCSALCWKR